MALGLAVGLLSEDGSPRVNLLPPHIMQKRAVRRQVLITAVCAAAVLVLMAVLTMGLISRIDSLQGQITRAKAGHSIRDTIALVAEQKQVEARIKQISQGHERLGGIIKAPGQIDWPGVLADVRDVTPQSLYITRLASQVSDKPEMVIEGFSFGYAAIDQFTKNLNQSKHIASATMVRSGQEGLEGKTYFSYQIRCALGAKTGI